MSTKIAATSTDWTILAAVKTALTGAVNGDSVAWFKAITIATTPEQAEQCQRKGDQPSVTVLWSASDERPGPEGIVCCVMTLSLQIRDKKDSGVDETLKTQRLFDLKNVAFNAIESAKSALITAGAKGFGWPDEYHDYFSWGDIEFVEEGPPWIGCNIPLELAYHLTSHTAH